MPVRARTSDDLPWSTWPAVATTCTWPPSRQRRARRTAFATMPSSAGSTVRRSSLVVSSETRAMTGGSAAQRLRGGRRAPRHRSGRHLDAGHRAAPGDGRPARRPLPASRAVARRRLVDRDAWPFARTGSRRRRAGGRRSATSCSAASTSPPGRTARASGWRAQPRDEVGPSGDDRRPAARPSSLSPEKVTSAAPAASIWRTPGLAVEPGRRTAGQPRASGVEQSGAGVDDDGRRRRWRARRPRRVSVKPDDR